MATIKDVAKRAGVSISTVSRVINGTAEVKDSKVDAIKEAIEYYKYQPSQLGRGLVTGETKIIGVYSPYSRNQLNMFYDDYLLEGLRGVDERIGQSKYSLLLLNEQSTANRLGTGTPKFEEYVWQKKIDGLIVMARAESDNIEHTLQQIIETGFPVAHFGKRIHAHDINVYASFEEYMQDAIEQFYKQGHRKILVCVGKNSESVLAKLKGRIQEKCVGAEIKIKSGDKDMSIDEIINLIKHDIEDGGITAMVWEHLDSVMLLIQALNLLGKKVPQDISVISVEHIKGKGACMLPKINSYYVPAKNMGRMLADALLRRLENKEELVNISQILYPEYMERDSVKTL